MTPQDIINQTNIYRKSQGIEPLSSNPSLMKAAQSIANDLEQKRYFSHQDPQGKMHWGFIKDSGYTYKYAGENLARNFPDATSTMAAWEASPTHNANLISSHFSDTGVAVLNGKVIQIFAAPETITSPQPTRQISKPSGTVSSLKVSVPTQNINTAMSQTTPQRI